MRIALLVMLLVIYPLTDISATLHRAEWETQPENCETCMYPWDAKTP